MKLTVNNHTFEIDSPGDTPLLWVIRDELGMTGTKYGCGLAQCGACSVMIDGVLARSCVTPVEGVVGKQVSTIEAIEADAVGQRVVQAWVKHQVPQCGYCQSGQVMAATALLKEVSKPSLEQVKAAMVNLCRCGTYNAIFAALEDLSGGGHTEPTAQAVSATQASSPSNGASPLIAAATLMAGAAAFRATRSPGDQVSAPEVE
ncbi:(2Fe-2S)-binding protein [Xanthomonas campestris]|uniref:(2Fe-2S)-binding protein n=1 Tax=Xanthomonas TaxID=338 RepID=UPI001E596941|nr:(2Fe-2S)-binding protein [Xanthomonas campestris]MCC5074401.1 (2Fe-2S)-binding protein [Xanthomonas campestris pv. plantaginis]MCC5091209.1 (2Fe-2S)-binding protein [Xanthomonas campestris]